MVEIGSTLASGADASTSPTTFSQRSTLRCRAIATTAPAARASTAAGPLSADERPAGQRRHRSARYQAGDGGAAASLSDAARRPGRKPRSRQGHRRDQGGDDQRALLPGPFPGTADHARRADRRGARAGRGRARGRGARPRRHRASSSISWRSRARSSASRSSPACCCRLEVEFVQKRSSVCKFAGRATIDGKLAAEASFTAMIADPPAA